MIAGPTPIWDTICEKATTTLAADIKPNSVGVSRRPSAMMATSCTAAWTPVPENVQNMPPSARPVSPGRAPAVGRFGRGGGSPGPFVSRSSMPLSEVIDHSSSEPASWLDRVSGIRKHEGGAAVGVGRGAQRVTGLGRSSPWRATS